VPIALEKLAGAADGRPEIVLPSHRRILLRLARGSAVWAIPEAGYHYAASARVATDSWLYLPKSGVYEARCSGACAGPADATLWIRVRAVPQAVYDDWLKGASQGPMPAGRNPAVGDR
jgi:heme/copper-type cytochrome/quinol oxidase subunit 2